MVDTTDLASSTGRMIFATNGPIRPVGFLGSQEGTPV